MIRFRTFCVLVFLFYATFCYAGDIGIYQGDGVAAVDVDGPVIAKIKARNEALKQAVQKAIMQSVLPQFHQNRSKTISKKILVKAGNYVLSYQVVKSGVEEGYYKVTVEARIKLALLSKDVIALADPADREILKRKKILILATRQRLEDEKPWEDLARPIEERLKIIDLAPLSEDETDRYFKSVAFQHFKEGQFDETYDLTASLDARYALIVRSLVTSSDEAGCPSMGKVHFLDLGNRKVLAEIPYHFQEGIGCQEAAEKAAKKIFSKLSSRLTGKGIFDPSATVHTVLKVFGLRNYQDTARLGSMLKALPDMKLLNMYSFATGGRVTYHIDYNGTGESLVKAISRFKPIGFSLVERSGPDKSLLFEAVY